MKTRTVQIRDRETLHAMIRRTGIFNEAEIECAMGIVDACLTDPPSSEYYVQCAVDDEDVPVGYISYGKASLTDSVYEIYWIVVDPQWHKKGVARELINYFYRWLADRKARMIVVETSSTDAYTAARNFYRKEGFEMVATVRDFYRTGDDKMIFVKRLA